MKRKSDIFVCGLLGGVLYQSFVKAVLAYNGFLGISFMVICMYLAWRYCEYLDSVE